jgi:hypothetical protein
MPKPLFEDQAAYGRFSESADVSYLRIFPRIVTIKFNRSAF